jgi:hypothetical protein
MITQQQIDMAILAVVGAVALGLALVGLEWLVKRLTRRPKDVLPEPSPAAERRVYSWKENFRD